MNYLALPRQERLTPQPSTSGRKGLRPTPPRKSRPLPALRSREWPVTPRNPASNHRVAVPRRNPSPVIARKPANREITPIGHRLTTRRSNAGRATLLPSTGRGTRIPESPRTASGKRLRPRKNFSPRIRLPKHPDTQPRSTTKNLAPKPDHPDFDVGQMVEALRAIAQRYAQAQTASETGQADRSTLMQQLRRYRQLGRQTEQSGQMPTATFPHMAGNIDINAFQAMFAQLAPRLGEFGGAEAATQLLIWQLATEITSFLLQKRGQSNAEKGRSMTRQSAFGMDFMPRSHYTTFAFDVGNHRLGTIGLPNTLAGFSPALTIRIVAHELDHLFKRGKPEDHVRQDTGTRPQDIKHLDPDVHRKVPKGWVGGYCSYGNGSLLDRLSDGLSGNHFLEPDCVIDLAKMGRRLPV